MELQEKNSRFGIFAATLRHEIESHGWKQKDVAELAAVKTSAISNYLAGERMPGAEQLYRLSRALGVSMEYLLTGEESGAGGASAGSQAAYGPDWRGRASAAEAELREIKAALADLSKKFPP